MTHIHADKGRHHIFNACFLHAPLQAHFDTKDDGCTVCAWLVALFSATNLLGMPWSWAMGGLTVPNQNCRSNKNLSGAWLHSFAGCGTYMHCAAQIL